MKKTSLTVKKRYLVFREDIKYLLDIVQKKIKKEKVKTLYLDFSEVNFLSRSFIDEFLNMIEDFKKKKLIIKIVNLKPQLEKFLRQVKKRKEKIRKEINKPRS